MSIVVHTPAVEAIEADLLQRWRQVPVAVIADTSAGACLVDPVIRPLRPAGQQPRLFGRAVTALCAPPDFGAVLRALDLVGAGDVLVIAAQGHGQHAMIGEILGGHLRRKGAAGVVCDGAIRDVAELAGWNDFAMYSRSVTPRGPTGAAHGELNATVTFGGLAVKPGDIVSGDDDGLAVINPALAHQLISGCEAKLKLESEWQAKLAAGQSVAQVFGL
ncbi:MAG: dimethylmenaquinone methyltransferase [Alphaproteobacteria bacterium]|nr:dimethylmenaquinone methyltransferase [Alphaproteobacteria bacterium]